MNKILFTTAITCILVCLFPPLLHSRQEAIPRVGTIVVSATKHRTALRNVSTSTTVITREEIIARGHKNVVEALRDVAGFDIKHSGGPGGLSMPQMRGLTGRFIVVMIDGVRVNDPSDANGGAGTIFSHLTTEDIECIEVVRGSLSPLYGSNAAAGVINIITRTGSGAGDFKLSYESGSLNSHRLNFQGGIGKKGFNFRAGQSITATDGIIDLETYRNYTTSVKIGYEKEKAFDWSTLVRYTRMNQNYSELKENYDAGFGGSFWACQVPDPNQENKFDYTTIGNRFKHWIKESWQHEFNFGVSIRDRKTVDPDDGQLGTMPAPYDAFSLDWMNFYNKGQQVPVFESPWGAADYSYKGTNYDLDYRHTFLATGERFSDIFTAGFEYLYQDYDQKGTLGVLNKNISTASVYIHNQTLFLDDALSLNAGLRYDNQKETDASTTGMVGVAYDIVPAGLILRSHFGSAFRAPSVFELYSPSGNLGLEPEKSKSYELGIEKYVLDKRLRFRLGYWFTDVNDVIIWVMTDPATFSGEYRNFDEAESKGIEFTLDARPHENWRLGFNYTYTDSRKFDTAAAKWSRNVLLPFNKLNLNLTWLYREGSVSVDGYWVDDTRLRWNGVDKMDSYFKMDLTGRIPFHKKFTGTLRVRNLFDKDYYEGMGIREAGIGIFAGIELNL